MDVIHNSSNPPSHSSQYLMFQRNVELTWNSSAIFDILESRRNPFCLLLQQPMQWNMTVHQYSYNSMNKNILISSKIVQSLKLCYRNKLCDPWNDPLYRFTCPCSFSLLLVWFKTLAQGSLAQGQTSGRLALAPMHHGSAVPLVLQMCFHWNQACQEPVKAKCSPEHRRSFTELL